MTIFNIILFCLVMNPLVSTSEESTSGTIYGIVTDYSGHPLINATVMIIGTSMGAMTGVNGEFIITEVAQGSYTLRAYIFGMNSSSIEVEVTSGSRSVVEFKLMSEFSEEIPVIIEI